MAKEKKESAITKSVTRNDRKKTALMGNSEWEEWKKKTMKSEMKWKKVVMAANFKLYKKKINNMNKQKKRRIRRKMNKRETEKKTIATCNKYSFSEGF